MGRPTNEALPSPPVSIRAPVVERVRRLGDRPPKEQYAQREQQPRQSRRRRSSRIDARPVNVQEGERRQRNVNNEAVERDMGVLRQLP
jgi:hypothetical protein